MGRKYIVPFSASALTAARDLVELRGHAAVLFRLLEIRCTQKTEVGDAQAEMLKFDFKKGTGAWTSGSGGGTPTPTKMLSGDAAAVVGADTMNSTLAGAGSGALTTLFTINEHVANGLHWLPTPECQLEFSPGSNPDGFVLSLAAPADAIDIDGYAVFEEIG